MRGDWPEIERVRFASTCRGSSAGSTGPELTVMSFVPAFNVPEPRETKGPGVIDAVQLDVPDVSTWINPDGGIWPHATEPRSRIAGETATPPLAMVFALRGTVIAQPLAHVSVAAPT